MDNTPVVQVSSPEQPQLPVPLKKNNLKLIIVGIVILLVFISGGLYLGKTIYTPNSLSPGNIVSITEISSSTGLGLDGTCGKPKYQKSNIMPPPDRNYEKCVRNYAVIHNDPSICAKQTNPSCFYTISKNQKDKNICNGIKGISERPCKNAVALAFRDVNLCPTVDMYDKANCIKGIAFIEQDIDLCNQLKDVNSYFWCISEIAIKKQDPLLCNRIDKNRLTDNFKVDICTEAVANPKLYPNPLFSTTFDGELDNEIGLK